MSKLAFKGPVLAFALLAGGAAHAQTTEIGEQTVINGDQPINVNVGGPEIQVNTPDVQVPVTVNNAGDEINVAGPTVNAGDVNVGGPEVNVGGPTVNVGGPEIEGDTNNVTVGGPEVSTVVNNEGDEISNNSDSRSNADASSNADSRSNSDARNTNNIAGDETANTNTNAITGSNNSSYFNSTRVGAITAGVQAAPVINAHQCVGGVSIQIGGGSPFAGSGGLGVQFIGKAGVPFKDGHTINDYGNATPAERQAMIAANDFSDSELTKLSCLTQIADQAKAVYKIQLDMERTRQAGLIATTSINGICNGTNARSTTRETIVADRRRDARGDDKSGASFTAAASGSSTTTTTTTEQNACVTHAAPALDRSMDYLFGPAQ